MTDRLHCLDAERQVSYILPVEERVVDAGPCFCSFQGAVQHVLYIRPFKNLSGYQRGVDWLFRRTRYRKLAPCLYRLEYVLSAGPTYETCLAAPPWTTSREKRLVRRGGCITLEPIMSSAGKHSFPSARPQGFTGRGDKYLGEIAQELRRLLCKTQKYFAFPSCRLPDDTWTDVSALLVEWAEDVHNDIGLWRTVETHQRQCFGTPLPLIVNASPEVELRGFDPRRIQFFLWSLWPCFNPERVISPAHEDLKRLAEVASRLLAERFARLPRDSGVTQFLASPNDYGWDIKRKLVWLGINSYLFHFLFLKYVDDHQREPDIQTKDDFVCQHCTEWSGLGVTDVLAGTLDVPAEDRATLRT